MTSPLLCSDNDAHNFLIVTANTFEQGCTRRGRGRVEQQIFAASYLETLLTPTLLTLGASLAFRGWWGIEK